MNTTAVPVFMSTLIGKNALSFMNISNSITPMIRDVDEELDLNIG